jgi:hypothetical protein
MVYLLDNSGNILTDQISGAQLTNVLPSGGGTVHQLALTTTLSQSVPSNTTKRNNGATIFWVTEGDSRTAPDGIHVPASQMYPELYAANQPLITLNNVAISGSFLSDNGMGGTNPASLIVRGPTVDALIGMNPGYTYYILSVWIGANDSHLGPGMVNSSVPYMSLLSQYCDLRRAAGYKIIVCTEIAEFLSSDNPNYSNWVAFRSVFNPTVQGWIGTHIDALADFNSTSLGPPASAANTSLFSDSIHPTALGQSILSPVMGGALSSLFALVMYILRRTFLVGRRVVD